MYPGEGVLQFNDNRQFRVPGYDYSQAGAYFVTICTLKKVPFLGEVVDGRMVLSRIGRVAEKFWLEIPDRFTTAELDEYVIMPDHVHGIIVLTDDGRGGHTPRRGAAEPKEDSLTGRHLIYQMRPVKEKAVDERLINRPRSDPQEKDGYGRHTPRRVPTTLKPLAKGSISSIVNHYKGNVKRYCNKNGMADFAWQRRFFDHVIRSESGLNKIRRYIGNNPARWQLDKDYPENLFSD